MDVCLNRPAERIILIFPRPAESRRDKPPYIDICNQCLLRANCGLYVARSGGRLGFHIESEADRIPLLHDVGCEIIYAYTFINKTGHPDVGMAVDILSSPRELSGKPQRRGSYPRIGQSRREIYLWAPDIYPSLIHIS